MQVHDEVCGMDFEEDRAAAKVDFQGTTYFFCSDHCRSTFEADPGKYAGAPDDSEPAGGGDHGHHH